MDLWHECLLLKLYQGHLSEKPYFKHSCLSDSGAYTIGTVCTLHFYNLPMYHPTEIRMDQEWRLLGNAPPSPEKMRMVQDRQAMSPPPQIRMYQDL